MSPLCLACAAVGADPGERRDEPLASMHVAICNLQSPICDLSTAGGEERGGATGLAALGGKDGQDGHVSGQISVQTSGSAKPAAHV